MGVYLEFGTNMYMYLFFILTNKMVIMGWGGGYNYVIVGHTKGGKVG